MSEDKEGGIFAMLTAVLYFLAMLVFCVVIEHFLMPGGQPTVRSFRGYECTDDCSGHEAGYEWAERKGITDPDDCGGKSESFIEGCRSYAEEQGYGGEDDDDDYDYQYLWGE